MNTTYEFWLRWMTEGTVQLAVLILLIGVVTWFCRRLSARLRYALWTLVLVKALLPPFWSVPFSVANLAGTAGFQPASKAVNTVGGKAEGTAAGTAGILPVSKTESTENLLEPQASCLHPGQAGSLRSQEILFTFWLTGTLSFWAIMLYRYVWAVRLLGKGRIVETGPLRETLDRLRKQLGVRSRPQIVLSNAVGSPFLWGVCRPSIALPAEFPGETSAEELESVLLHELTHWKRGDLFVTHLEFFVLGIFWFHPLVWGAVSLLRRERESACDEAVLATGCIEAKRYGDSLVNVLEFVRDRSPLPAAFLGITGILERKTQLHKRLEEIMTQHHHVRKIGLFGWILLLFFAACVLPMAIADGEKGKTCEKPVVSAFKTPDSPVAKDKTRLQYEILFIEMASHEPGDGSIWSLLERKKDSEEVPTNGTTAVFMAEAMTLLLNKLEKTKNWSIFSKMRITALSDTTTEIEIPHVKGTAWDEYKIELFPFHVTDEVVITNVKLRTKENRDTIEMTAQMNPDYSLVPDRTWALCGRFGGKDYLFCVTGIPVENQKLRVLGKLQQITSPFEPQKAVESSSAAWDAFGIKFSSIPAEEYKQQYPEYRDIYPDGGIQVTEVRPNSPMHNCGVEAGDVIFGINGWVTGNEEDVRLIIADLKGNKAKSVDVFLCRPRSYDGEPAKGHFVAIMELPPDWWKGNTDTPTSRLERIRPENHEFLFSVSFGAFRGQTYFSLFFRA